MIMAYTDWPKIIQEINEKYGTAFAPGETGPALIYMVAKFNGCVSHTATMLGVGQSAMYRVCRIFKIERKNTRAPKVNWPEALIQINNICHTAYDIDDLLSAMTAIVAKEGGYRQAAMAIGCNEVVFRSKARNIGVYEPQPRKTTTSTFLGATTELIDLDKWHRSGMTKSPCAMCPIGTDTKERTECFQCTARIEYANAQAGMPALPGADSMQQVQYMRQSRMSACS